MARDFIPISITSAQGPLLKSAVIAMRTALSQLAQCRAIATHNNDGTIFTDIETYFGLPSGTGQTVFNLLNGAYGSTQGTFQVSDFQTMCDKLG
jgi:hypothetical protein